MDNSILGDIINYICFLKNIGYYVSLSGFGDSFEPYTEKLLPYEIHTHTVCSYLKQNGATLGRCVINKQKLNSANIPSPIYSCCYAGVEEYVVPVIYNGTCIMRINASGYRGTLEKSERRMNRIREICGIDFLKAYNELSTETPSLDQVMMFIKPLEYMIVSLYLHCQSVSSASVSRTKSIYLRSMEYIHENYMHKISCNTLAKELSYSPSYLRYVFKKEAGVSINKQITEIRLERARQLLCDSSLNVTDVAFCCGFCDANYFSSVFKNKYGVPPKAYGKIAYQ